MAINVERCKCRRYAIDPCCPRHGIGSKRYIANLVGLVVVFSVAVIAIFTAPTKAASKTIPLTICEVFGDRYCGQALRVAWCESRLDTRARNGQYRGLFQMGYSERHRYGHGPDALSQARAAFRYFVASGKDWSPWSCKP